MHSQVTELIVEFVELLPNTRRPAWFHEACTSVLIACNTLDVFTRVAASLVIGPLQGGHVQAVVDIIPIALHKC